MSKRLSEIYGMDIFTEKAEYVGKVGDIILNLEQGEIMQLSLSPLRTLGTDVRRVLQEETIPYEEVIRIGDIIICKKNPRREGKTKEGKAPRTTV
ncbi:MAG: PRC-barrel domain-containing protein [Candidatus Altiarchaeota archaeon]|nr:PRC-barrel domain-containing protein [Candidatus Altiarchaeota archaeon]